MLSVAEFWDLLQGARGTLSYEFSRMRAHFLLCYTHLFKDLEDLSPKSQVSVTKECDNERRSK